MLRCANLVQEVGVVSTAAPAPRIPSTDQPIPLATEPGGAAAGKFGARGGGGGGSRGVSTSVFAIVVSVLLLALLGVAAAAFAFGRRVGPARNLPELLTDDTGSHKRSLADARGSGSGDGAAKGGAGAAGGGANLPEASNPSAADLAAPRHTCLLYTSPSPRD